MTLSRETQFERVDISNWKQLVDLLNGFGPEWIFRGQADASWPLETTLARRCPAGKRWASEQRLLRYFRARAVHLLRPISIPTTRLGWYAVMQHHGGPTRLLDCTTSPYIAAFFALENALRPNVPAAVWAINRNLTFYYGLRGVGQAELKIDPYDEDDVPVMDTESSRDLFDRLIDEPRPLVIPFSAIRGGERAIIQQGVFMCVGDVEKSFVENLAEGRGWPTVSSSFKRIEIPQGVRCEALEQLQKMNVTRASLFPGLDGLAGSLNALLGE